MVSLRTGKVRAGAFLLDRMHQWKPTEKDHRLFSTVKAADLKGICCPANPPRYGTVADDDTLHMMDKNA